LPESGPAAAQQAGKPGRTAKFVVGAPLLLLFAASVIIQRTDGNETTKSSHAGEGTSMTTTTTTTTSVSTPPKNESSNEVSKSLPSEGVLLALLGIGLKAAGFKVATPS
jgi:hypothetical protein